MDRKILLSMIHESSEIKVPPFSLMYVGGALKKAGYEVKILHYTPEKINQCVEIVLQERPLFTGFSVLSGPPAFYTSVISKKLKDRIGIPIVWGGVHPSLLPEQCLKEDYIDIVVIGEGEETIVELARAIENNKSLEDTQGIGYKNNGKKIVINPPRPFIKNLDNYRIDFNLVDLGQYINERIEISQSNKKQVKRSLGYITSRGCPHSCGFCYNLKFNQRKWRAYSNFIVIEDIKFLKEKFGVNEIHFWDDNFFVDKGRAFKILGEIDVSPGIEIRIDAIDEEIVSRLKELNADQLLIGIESGSNRILKFIDKGFDINEILEKVKILAKYNMSVLYSLILGIPTETQNELFMTLDLMLKIHKVHRQASFTVGSYLPYPGTPLYELAVKEKFIPPQNTGDWNRIDRWKNEFCLPWTNNKLILNVRNLMSMLSWDIKLLNSWIRFRIRHRILLFSYDIAFFINARIFFKNILKNAEAESIKRHILGRL